MVCIARSDDGNDDAGEGVVEEDEEKGDGVISTGCGDDVGGADAGGAGVISRDDTSDAAERESVTSTTTLMSMLPRWPRRALTTTTVPSSRFLAVFRQGRRRRPTAWRSRLQLQTNFGGATMMTTMIPSKAGGIIQVLDDVNVEEGESLVEEANATINLQDRMKEGEALSFLQRDRERKEVSSLQSLFRERKRERKWNSSLSREQERERDQNSLLSRDPSREGERE